MSGKQMKAGVAVLAAIATLGAGGVVASTAFAGGGGGNQPGAGGNLDAVQFWQYKDDASGAWGPATSLDSVRAAMNNAGVTLKGNGITKVQAALDQARTECETGFQQRHPGEGDGDCRVVAVGAVPAVSGGSFIYDGSGWYSPTGTGGWYDNWNTYVASGTYQYGNTVYKTSYPFDDDPSNSVDAIMRRNVEASSKPSIVVIVLDKYQPAPPETPPAPPTKKIESGTSADGMSNETVISTGTGIGGKKMTIADTINPNGMAYKVTGQKVMDTTDGKDVTGQFDFNTTDGQAAPNNVATATWKGGDLPEKHTYEYHLTITVSTPQTSKVTDTPSVTWNDKGTGKADGHEFPTWQPNPDKSWVLYRNGKWLAVVDSEETNQTGADNMKFLDGDTVGSAVNGTVDPGLKAAPSKLELTDDWTSADYLVDAQDPSKIKVFAHEAEPDETTTVDGKTVTHLTKTNVADIANTGTDVTDKFDIVLKGTTATATAKADYLQTLKGMKKGLQLTMLVPFTVNFADGKGAAQVRDDFGKQPGDELTFCTSPDGKELTNKGSQTVNGQTEPTNEPKVCGYVSPVKKDVIAESSQGGDQESVDGKVVYPGQKVEYQLTTQPTLPSDLATIVTSVSFTDSYDAYLTPDKQTVEMMDLNTGKVVPKSKYKTEWDESKHLFRLTVTDGDLIAQWCAAQEARAAGTGPRIQIRFEGTVKEDAPTDHKVNNKWVLTLNNGLTPSNEVFNLPPNWTPSKEDNQSKEQGDPTISIDGKTMLLGDTGNYVVNLDARQKDNAYKVWRLGVTDDFDDEYVSIDPSKIEVIGQDGKDHTNDFNIQLKDGVVYAYAKTVDTEIPATGETVKGDPQPADLKAYSEKSDKDYNALTDPAIDQKLLGQTYQVIMPYKVIEVTDGKVVENTATQVVNGLRKQTNTVSNPLKPINPKKDVTVKVGGDSIDGKSVYLGHTFLYRLDSSILPANRAYPTITAFTGTDQLDTAHDQYLGNWAVYAQRDLYKDGKVIAKKGERIAGANFDSSKFGGDLFAVAYDDAGKLTVTGTQTYLDLVSADNVHEAGWTLYIQCKRIAVSDKVPNTWTETINGTQRESNTVWTRTPDLTPSIHLEKVDEPTMQKDGQEAADRDDPKRALKMNGDSTRITFIITNTSKVDSETGTGAWFKASDLKLTDSTIVGDAHVDMGSLTYPANWDTLVLKPGESVSVTGTLRGVQAGDKHTDRASVTGTPLVECAPVTGDPFTDGGTDDGGDKTEQPANATTVDGKTLCADTSVNSNMDDWNGYRAKPLASTGVAVLGLAGGALAALLAGCSLLVWRKRHSTPGAGRHTAVVTGE